VSDEKFNCLLDAALCGVVGGEALSRACWRWCCSLPKKRLGAGDGAVEPLAAPPISVEGPPGGAVVDDDDDEARYGLMLRAEEGCWVGEKTEDDDNEEGDD